MLEQVILGTGVRVDVIEIDAGMRQVNRVPFSGSVSVGQCFLHLAKYAKVSWFTIILRAVLM